MPSQTKLDYSPEQTQTLIRLLTRLIDQTTARIIVEPQAAKTGYWFGGGNAVEDDDGVIWLRHLNNTQ